MPRLNMLFKRTKRDGRPPAGSSRTSPADYFREAGERKLSEGDFEAAIGFYDEAIRVAPTDHQLLLSRAVAYRLSGPAKYEFAINDANTAISSQSDSWRAWDIKGDIQKAMGDYDGALESYQNAIGFAKPLDRPRIQSSLAEARGLKFTSISSSRSPSSGTSAQSPRTHVSSEPVQELPGSSSYQNPSPRQGTTLATNVNRTPTMRQTPSAPVTATNTTRSGSSFTVDDLTTRGETVPEVPPPSYTPPAPTTQTTPATTNVVNLLASFGLGGSFTTTTSAALTARNRGKLSVRPYTATRNVDAIQLVYVGLTASQLTTRELSTTPLGDHPSHKLQLIDETIHPGTNFLDKDCEASTFYAGKIPGTTTIAGYSLEYRLAQIAHDPNLQMESLRQGLPQNSITDIVAKLQNVNRDVEDNAGLRPLLGLSQLDTLQSGFGPGGRLQDRIVNICIMITRTHFDEPTRVRDFSAIGNMTSFLKPSATLPNQTRDFLFQILLGIEVFLRVKMQTVKPSYASIITHNISCMMLAGDRFKSNINIVPKTTSSAANPQYDFEPLKHISNAAGLIAFAESIRWPFLEEAKRTINAATQALASGTWPVGPDLCDWLFGLVLPGKMHRHLILGALVQATPSVSSFAAAPYYDNGLVLEGRASYWPQRTALGRVLGGSRSMTSTCGWIGPGPAPRGASPRGAISGWVFISTEKALVPTPLVTTLAGLADTAQGNPNDYIIPTAPIQRAGHRGSVLKHLNLDLIQASSSQALLVLITSLVQESYRVSLDFEVNGVPVRYTLYRNPIFVTAPPCVGTHPMLRSQAEQRLRDMVAVPDLRATIPEAGKLLIINALGDGDEMVARAWCAEHGKNAIVRRNEPGLECCLTCACTLAASGTGLNINVVIWSR